MKDAGLTILLADDDKDDVMLFQEALEDIQVSTRFLAVHDGEELMNLLLKDPKESPSVIFLDLNMPRKNGVACLTEIKDNENLKKIPVIIFSTSYEEDVANMLYKSGAHHYICKPAEFSELKKVIEYSLRLISEEKTVQPPKEKFLLSNLKSILF